MPQLKTLHASMKIKVTTFAAENLRSQINNTLINIKKKKPSSRFLDDTTHAFSFILFSPSLNVFMTLVKTSCGSDSKESACNAGDLGLIPGLGSSLGEGNGHPLQYSCLENSMDREPGGL